MTADNAIQKTASPAVEVAGAPNRRNNWTYRPSVDIFDTADELLLISDMPGANPEQIDVSMESGILTLQANVESRDYAQARNVVHEYGIGSFHRRFEIDEAIDTEAVTAEYNDGVLTVHLPKEQQARRRRIPISA